MAANETPTEFAFVPFLHKVEAKWQKHWDDHASFKAANPGEPGSEKPKFYCLDMFPYPSGDGLHVGHPLGYLATDILSRYKRMKGFNVLHPMGWDAFGLPAEQHAIQKGIHPAITTQKNIATFKRQLKMLGLSYDWSREISTIEPSYYKWTQWLFKKLFEKGLAYQAEMAVNWCPALGTVLANDEVIDGKSERGGHPVERRPMRQWVLKITAYADRLIDDLKLVDWPESTKEHQRNWIGRSEGAKVSFEIKGFASKLDVFTTRPDTLFGVSFMALAPEHPLVLSICTGEQRKTVDAYIQAAAAKSERSRLESKDTKDKSGVFTGAYALHPLTLEPIPIWVADYILMNYGTGAIMGVPAHDERDLEFAKAFGLAIKTVVGEDGKLVNSQFGSMSFDGMPFKEGGQRITQELEQRGLGQKTINYRLRDWLFARQRYWGEPIPVIHVIEGPDKGKSRLLPDRDLPLTLPEVQKYEPTGTGESPLSAVTTWVDTIDPITGARARRETNTMPGSAGSSWYYLRYMDPKNNQAAWSKEAEKYWGPVDVYLGGSEHAVGHLLYSRFWHKVFFDLGLVSHPEPFQKLIHQGMILAEDGEKMSKSRGNVVNPDGIVEKYGADTLRLFEMFLGPLEKTKPWQTQSIEGVFRFLSRTFRLITDGTEHLSPKVKNSPESEWGESLVQSLHKAIHDVGQDYERMGFNTAISTLMVLVNEGTAYKEAKGQLPKAFCESLVLMLAPMAPHLCEELWQLLGHSESLARAPWPSFDPKHLKASTIEIAIQVNGKLRDTVSVSPDITEDAIKELVLKREAVQKWLEGRAPKKVIYVKQKLVSVVV